MATDIRVLIVDDSAFARLAITRELNSTNGISVIDTARDGREALQKIHLLKPDVITLDVEMPRMDGLATLEKIMTECPAPVVMLSSLTGNGTEATLRALELGAVDFFLKNTLANPVGDGDNANTLKNKIILAARVKVQQQKAPIIPMPGLDKPKRTISPGQPATNVVVIGSSTGGPKALYQVIPRLPADIPAAVVIVQHMPVGFTYSLAGRLSQLSNIPVKEAAQGDVLYHGAGYVAKGGYHLTIEKGGILSLNQNPAVCGVRPSVNVTMESAAYIYKNAVLGVVLTGMGSDGTTGSQHIKQLGGKVIVQDESTCVVWGMPKSVAESGLADRTYPLQEIAEGIMEALKICA